MNHILDNPIWNALQTGNKQFSFGDGNALYIKRDLGVFAGLRNNSKTDFDELFAIAADDNVFVLFTPGDIDIPAGWQLKFKKGIDQMTYEHKTFPVESHPEIVVLHDEHIPAMLGLTELTKPGPFLQRTIDFGNYEGIFDGKKLVAITGQRLQPLPYVEVSAVCTHPDYVGRGFAGKLIKSQLQKIVSQQSIPFLHAYSDNPAIHLYRKLGFETRREMVVHVVAREEKKSGG